MRKLNLILLCIAIFVSGCNKSDNRLEENVVTEMHFPKKNEQFGRAVANQIRTVVLNLNKLGVSYPKPDNSENFRNKFYQDVYRASPNIVKTKSSASQLNWTNKQLSENVNNLSSIQIEFVTKITNEVNRSKSLNDLQQIISKINQEILNKVPKIEQERLFNVTAALYYGAQEIQKLEESGHMGSLSHVNNMSPRLKSGSEETLGDKCKKFLATAWIIAVGEPTPAGEIVMSVVTVVVAGVLLYEVITCAKSGSGGGNPNQSYCQYRYATCSSTIINGCSICLQYCLGSGSWPPYSSHKCS